MDGEKDENFLTYLRFPRISKHQLNASQREYELANMKGRLLEISYNSLTTTLFHCFVRKNVFYSKNIQYAYMISMGFTCM